MLSVYQQLECIQVQVCVFVLDTRQKFCLHNNRGKQKNENHNDTNEKSETNENTTSSESKIKAKSCEEEATQTKKKCLTFAAQHLVDILFNVCHLAFWVLLMCCLLFAFAFVVVYTYAWFSSAV